MNTQTAPTKKPRKATRTENPEKLSIRARRDFERGYIELDNVKQAHINMLFSNAFNSSIWTVEKTAQAARKAQATAHFVRIVWDLIIDLEKRVPTEEELEAKADTVRRVYHLTPQEWPWKDELKKAFYGSKYFQSVRDFFPW